MNPFLKNIVDSKTVVDDDGHEYPLNSEVTGEVGALLQRMIRQEDPEVTLEVGLAYGVSAMFICEALQEGRGKRHIAVDPLQFGDVHGLDLQYDLSQWGEYDWAPSTGWRGIGVRNVEQAGYGAMLEHVNAPSNLGLPALLRDKTVVDFAFIDGWHTFDYVLLDFMYVDWMLREGGVVVFDDANNPAIRRVLRYVLTNRRYEVVGVDDTERKPRPLQHRVAASLAQRFTRVGTAVSIDIATSDAELGLPRRRSVALRKVGNDLLGDGSNGSRRWNHHVDF